MNPADLLPRVQIDSVDDVGTYLFLQLHRLRGDAALAQRSLRGPIGAEALADRARVTHSINSEHGGHLLVEIDDAVALVSRWRSGGEVLVTAADDAKATAIVEEIVSLAPAADDDRRVEARCTDATTGDRHIDVDVRPWAEVRHLYPAAVRTGIDELVDYRAGESTRGRILLWHGAPGTGKTSAIRALMQAWRGWAEPVVVTDPHALLDDGRYLRRVMLNNADDEKWQLLILEDAESLLDKKTGANRLAKLLNLSDGLLGQGLRCLFLVTTNQAVQAMHPALSRAGRCLANIEFTALSAAESAQVLGRPVARQMTLAELLATEPVAAESEAVAVGQYL